MAGEVKLAIILTASMRGADAFDRAGGGIKGIAAAAKSAIPMLAMFAAHATFNFLKDSIKIAMEFEKIMAEAGSIIGKTADEVKGLGDEIREMSQRIPKSPRDLGTALYDIFSAGVTDTADAMNALELSAKAASAGLTETATAAKAGIATMNAFGMEASDLEHIFDTQFLTIKYGILRYEELAAVVGQLSPAAKAAGQSMESMFAGLAMLTQKGLNAAEASTALARAMEGITKPAAIRAAAELGISFVEMTADSITARDEFLRQSQSLDELTQSYNDTEASVKSLGEEMAKVSLEEAKNRLEINKIKREAEKQDRELTKAEIDQIEALEEANKDLSIQYSELSVSQQEARIQSTELNNQLEEQKLATEEAKAAFDEQIAATGNFRPLVDIVKEINDKYGMLGEAAQADIIGKMFPEVRARRAILSILGSEEEMMAMTDEMMNQAGAMGEAYAINTDTAAAGHQLMQNSVEDLQIQIGEEMMPVMEYWNEIMRDAIIPLIKNAFIPILEAMMPIIKVMAEVLGWIAGIFAEYPELLWAIIGAIIAWKVAQIALNIAMTANPIGLIITAIALLVAGILILLDKLGLLEPIWEAITGTFQWLYDSILKPVFDGIITFVDLIVGAIEWMAEQIDKYFGWIIDAVSGVADVLGGIGDFFGGIGGAIGGFFGFQEGGIITQPTLGLLGEAGAEAVIPLKNGAVPVEIVGRGGVPAGDSGGTIQTHDTYTITIQAGALPQTETPESLSEKLVDAMVEAKKRGATGQVI